MNSLQAATPRHAPALALLASTLALTLGACGGDDSGPSAPKTSPQGNYLFVSVPEFYFSTQDVGVTRTQDIEIQNRGADRYPLESITVRGENADDFRTPIYDEVILEPAQAIRVPVTFAPLGDGRKLASLEIEYDTIKLVADSVNEQEQAFYQASDLARAGEYRAAERGYGEYLANDPVTVNRHRAAQRVPIVQEAERYGDGVDSRLYLEALDARDKGDAEGALLSLDALLLGETDSFLADDAQYLKGYVALLDLDDPRLALREFRELTARFPDSTYYDTALYGEAIAQERLGNDRLAVELYSALRERHTGVDAFGVRLPKDDLVARLWFGRADAALAAIDGARTRT